MIQLGHMATGILASRHVSSPVAAALSGVVMHGMMDVAPHGEINDRGWEVASVALAVPILAMAWGWRSPVVWGAIGGVLPDAEHLLPAKVRDRGPLFPTHRIDALHSSDTRLAIPAWAQVALGGAVIGWFTARGWRRRSRGA